MARFRRKPSEVDAFQWTGGPEQAEDPEWVASAIRSSQVRFINVGGPAVRIAVDEAINSICVTQTASPGAWLVRNGGRVVLVHADLFDELYEAVDGQP